MLTIGDFARYGRVSVRMPRHYDAIGLLRPARVDPAGGYRLYAAEQLGTLNRVIALKDLGFTLRQVGAILGERVSAEELRGMLRLRRAELEARMNADAARPAGVETRLRMIESEGHMPPTARSPSTPACRSRPNPMRRTASRSWTFRGSRRRRSCTVARWTPSSGRTSCRPGGWRPRAAAPAATHGNSTSTARPGPSTNGSPNSSFPSRTPSEGARRGTPPGGRPGPWGVPGRAGGRCRTRPARCPAGPVRRGA